MSRPRVYLELHTFSSLNPAFIPGYAGTMEGLGQAMVYFDPAAVAHKKLPALDPAWVQETFGPGVQGVHAPRGGAGRLGGFARRLPRAHHVVWKYGRHRCPHLGSFVGLRALPQLAAAG